MKKQALWYLCTAALFLICGIVGALILSAAPDTGLAKVRSVSDLYGLRVRIEWAQGDTLAGVETESGLSDIETAAGELADLTDNKQQYIEGSSGADLILLATATGGLDITNGTTGQEIKVDEVIRGSDMVSVGDTATVWTDYGLQVLGGEIVYRNIQNLMQPGKQYIVFLDSSPLNGIGGGNNFRLASYKFGYVHVPFKPDTALPGSIRCENYSVWAEYPSFVATDEIASARNEICKSLLQMYGYYES